MSDESEDPSPHPKRKIKKVMVVSSGSSSDSDDSGPTTSSRKKRLRVLSDDGSDSSSGSWAIGAIRRRRAIPGLRDSDCDSLSSGWATDQSDPPQTSTAPDCSPTASKSPTLINKAAKAVCGFSSDSSEGNSEKCSICLMKFLNQEVGTPQNCDHIFCLDCITEWSKNMNTCPVDRITFDSIVVRACAGGCVLRTDQVKVAERRPSLEVMIMEDPTVCEVCHHADREESMLLCDGCDLGFHMQCLTPPLTRIPEDQWLCPNCNGVWGSSSIFIPVYNSYTENYERSSERPSRAVREDDQPSTSSGRGRSTTSRNAPSTSRSSRALNSGATTSARQTTSSARQTTSSARQTTTRTRKRKYKRRTRTVIVEYEVQGEGKFPITKTKRVKTRLKKRKTKKRQPRTAARRTHVRASVLAKLATIRGEPSAPATSWTGGFAGDALSSRRAAAGVPMLNLFESDYQLDYFEEDENFSVSEGASTAVAARPTASIFSAYRQARRKMITVPSPTHASSASDILSNILESQTRLHSKNSIVSVTVDGNINIKLQTRERKVESRPEREPKPESETKPEKEPRQEREPKLEREPRPERTGLPQKRVDKPVVDKKDVDLTNGGESTRQAPSYPGQGRGWGGGYRYPRDQQNHNQGNQGYNRGGSYDNGYGGPQRGPGGGSGGGGGMYDSREDNNGQFNDYNNRRPHQFSNDDEPWHERNRRQQFDQNRGPPNQRNEDRRFSGGPAWRPNRPDGPPQRHSLGGFDNPVDMRMSHESQGPRLGFSRSNSYPDAAQHDKPQTYRPLPQPPSFHYENLPQEAEQERDDEDERSDEGLVIDTEKYDPTEPTNDDESGDENQDDENDASNQQNWQPEKEPTPPSSPPPIAALPPPPLPPEVPSVETILAGINTRVIDVPQDVLDSAVRQVLEEHRALLTPSGHPNEGDCPNFSIYSATSVHIASSSNIIEETPIERRNSLEDLVQGDGELTPPEPPALSDEPDDALPVTPTKPTYGLSEVNAEDYKAKVSKRCPITTNTRNPIKIKLNTPSLIKRNLSLYDDEDVTQDLEDNIEPAIEVQKESATEKNDIEESKEEPKVQNQSESEQKESLDSDKVSEDPKETTTPYTSDTEATPKISDEADKDQDKDLDDDRTGDELEIDDKDKKSDSEDDASSRSNTPHSQHSPDLVKMTESISETEDERSYTPCLDENKSKDASLEDKGIEGLDTEMISEEEGNEMFSEGSPPTPDAPAPDAPPPEEGEILDKKKDDNKKKKKKEGKKEKEGKTKRKRGITFKKAGKGKDRNYREREKEKDKKRSPASSRERRRRKDKRKDLERYDVRTLVSERRRKVKDKFGRDVSPSGSRSLSPAGPPPRRASSSPAARRGSTSPRRVRLSSSPRRVRLSPSPRRVRLSPSPRRIRLSPSPRRVRMSPSPRRARLSISPRRRQSLSPRRRPSPIRARSPTPRRRFSPSPIRRRSMSPLRRRGSPSPIRRRVTPSPRRRSPSPRRARISPSPRRRLSPSPRRRASLSPRRPLSAASPSPKRRRKRSGSRVKVRRRRSPSKVRKRRRSASPAASPKPTKAKKKKRAGSKQRSPRRRSTRRKRLRHQSASPPPMGVAWSPPMERAPSPRTPPPVALVPLEERRRRREVERAHRRLREAAGPSKEVFTSGDNILVSVSFKEQERAEGIGRRERRKERRRRRRRAAAEPGVAAAKPVAIIDLERSPFRELTPSPKNVIVLSDDEAERSPAVAPPPAAEPAPGGAQGPKTPPEPPEPGPQPAPQPAVEGGSPRGPLTPPEPPDSPDAYDPYEPTRSASNSPPAPAPPPAADDDASRPTMTLEAAQKTNLSADEVLDRRPLSPIEKVMALLQSTRDISPEEPQQRVAGASPGGSVPPPSAPEPPGATAAVAPAPRIALPEPRPPPKLFLAKPSPIKSDPIKPMPQATKISRLPMPAVVAGVRRRSQSPGGGASPYSPGSSDFGELFEPPPPPRRDIFEELFDHPKHPRGRNTRNGKPKRSKKGKTTVDVKLDDDNLKILDDLPSSAVEMQVKSKFLKKLNRQERVVEEVKLVLKPHYNKKHVTKEEYKHILRRTVPKICHNKTGEINPTKIQALVEAYVKKFRKKRKLGQ